MGAQPSDIRIAVITGTTGGVTGGDIMGPESIGIIHDISYAEMGTLGTQEVLTTGAAFGAGVTGARVTVRVQPSGANIDVKTIGPNQSLVYGQAREAWMGNIPQSNVLQVVTSVGNVAVRVVYHVEPGFA